jgi:hypothetical protein
MALGVACAFSPVTHLQAARVSTRGVLDFDTTSWRALLKSGPRPAAYVFTTTYCSTCPEVFELLAKFIQSSGKKVELVAVVMDVSGDLALRHAHHYMGATRIYAFDGFEPEIRQTVDPSWRNITPYVALLGSHGKDERVIGPPSAVQLKTWLS